MLQCYLGYAGLIDGVRMGRGCAFTIDSRNSLRIGIIEKRWCLPQCWKHILQGKTSQVLDGTGYAIDGARYIPLRGRTLESLKVRYKYFRVSLWEDINLIPFRQEWQTTDQEESLLLVIKCDWDCIHIYYRRISAWIDSAIFIYRWEYRPGIIAISDIPG